MEIRREKENRRTGETVQFTPDNVKIKTTDFEGLNVRGTLAGSSCGAVFRFYCGKSKLGDIAADDVVDALKRDAKAKAAGKKPTALKTMLLEHFNQLKQQPTELVKTPAMFAGAVLTAYESAKKTTGKEPTRKRKGGVPLFRQNNGGYVDALRKEELLILLELMKRAPKHEQETVGTLAMKRNETDPAEMVLYEKDFCEMARNVYGRNEPAKRKAAFDAVRGIGTTEFSAEVPIYEHKKDKSGHVRNMRTGSKRISGTLFSYAYDKDEYDNYDGKANKDLKINVSLSRLFYYFRDDLYTNLDLTAMEKATRIKGGGIALRASLYAASFHPQREMHEKHHPDRAFTVKVPMPTIFVNYEQQQVGNKAHNREAITDDVLEAIRNITKAENVTYFLDGIAVKYQIPTQVKTTICQNELP